MRARLEAWLAGVLGWALLALCLAASASLLTWSAADPSFIRTANGLTRNALGPVGANFADVAMRLFGLAGVFLVLPPLFWALQLITRRRLEEGRIKVMLAPAAVLLLACAASALPGTATWPLPYGLGGLLGDQTLRFLGRLLQAAGPHATMLAGGLCLVAGAMLLLTSLGMSLRDLALICRGAGPRLELLARGWRQLTRAPERGRDMGGFVRREPTLEMAPSGLAEARRPPFPAEPAFDYEPPIPSAGHPGVAAARKHVKSLRRPVRDPEPDGITDPAAQDMARRFAPSREEPSDGRGFGILRRRAGPRGDRGDEGEPGRTPVWPGSVPAQVVDPGMPPAEPYPPDGGLQDELYGRAVAIVRAQRKASTAYLQQSLGIRYMRAADLIDRMEREGIVGAPIQNGVRPILAGLARPRVV